MKRKTVAQIVKEHLIETENPGIMFGDSVLIDEIAEKCIHTNLSSLHPCERHSRVLTYCEKSDLFDKQYIEFPGMRGNQKWRYLILKK